MHVVGCRLETLRPTPVTTLKRSPDHVVWMSTPPILRPAELSEQSQNYSFWLHTRVRRGAVIESLFLHKDIPLPLSDPASLPVEV